MEETAEKEGTAGQKEVSEDRERTARAERGPETEKGGDRGTEDSEV
jgi:hypothetical protein